MKRKLGRVSFVMAFMMALAALPAAAQEDVTLTFWTFVDAHADYFLDRAAEFDAMHPEINFKLETVSMPYQEMHDQLLIALQTGIGAPDIVDIEITPFARYLREPIHLHELTRIVDPHRHAIIQNRLTPYQKNGRQYGIPTHLGAFVTFYNAEVYANAGLDFEQIDLWDDYIEMGKKLTRDIDGDGTIDQWATMLDGNGWF